MKTKEQLDAEFSHRPSMNRLEIIAEIQSDARAELEQENKLLTSQLAELCKANSELGDATTQAIVKQQELESENNALREKLDRYAIENPTICYQCGNESEDLKTVQELRERLQKAEAACVEMRSTIGVLIGGLHAKALNNPKIQKACDLARFGDCGTSLLDRMKAMEEILDGLMCQKFTRKLGSPCDCDACRWNKLKESK